MSPRATGPGDREGVRPALCLSPTPGSPLTADLHEAPLAHTGRDPPPRPGPRSPRPHVGTGGRTLGQRPAAAPAGPSQGSRDPHPGSVPSAGVLSEGACPWAPADRRQDGCASSRRLCGPRQPARSLPLEQRLRDDTAPVTPAVCRAEAAWRSPWGEPKCRLAPPPSSAGLRPPPPERTLDAAASAKPLCPAGDTHAPRGRPASPGIGPAGGHRPAAEAPETALDTQLQGGLGPGPPRLTRPGTAEAPSQGHPPRTVAPFPPRLLADGRGTIFDFEKPGCFQN